MRPTVSASLSPKEEIEKAPPADGAALSFSDGARNDRPCGRMLILARRIGESLEVGDDVRVTMLAIKGNQVRIGIDAPRQVAVHREEIHRRVTAAANNLTAKADTCGTSQVVACNSCYAANWGGWALHLEEAVTRKSQGEGSKDSRAQHKGSSAARRVVATPCAAVAVPRESALRLSACRLRPAVRPHRSHCTSRANKFRRADRTCGRER